MNESFNTILKFPFSFILKYFLRNHVNYFKFHFCYILKQRIVMINTRHHSKGLIYIYLFIYSTIQTTELGVLLALFYKGGKKDREVREVSIYIVWFQIGKECVKAIYCHPAYLTSMQSQLSSVAQSCPTLCDPMTCSTPGLPVHYQLPEFTQTHVHRVSDAIQPSHPLSSPSPPAPNHSQHQSLFQ